MILSEQSKVFDFLSLLNGLVKSSFTQKLLRHLDSGHHIFLHLDPYLSVHDTANKIIKRHFDKCKSTIVFVVLVGLSVKSADNLTFQQTNKKKKKTVPI